MAEHWYVIRTKPQAEHTAASALEREGFDLFFPRVRTIEADTQRQDAPLFPGYMFLRYDMEAESPTAITRLPGVLEWVSFDDVIPAVPHEVVSILAQRVRQMEEDGGLWMHYREGDMVRVVSGKMDSLARVLEEPRSPEARVSVLMEFMGRMVPAQVNWADLRPTNQNQEEHINRRASRRTRGRGRWIKGFGPKAAVTA